LKCFDEFLEAISGIEEESVLLAAMQESDDTLEEID